jgi:4-diphosphocytidyl-2-C-methyl-D-erythritol kinase
MIATTLEAPAKVNLRLVVLAREVSGFHSLETLFCGISLADIVSVEPAGAGIDLEVHGSVDTGPPERNLAVHAARRFHEAIHTPPAVRIRLEKRIPSAAGLGGGSSDAAATLRALNAAHGAPLDSGSLLRIGASLGSDVPFFLGASPFALAWGRGDRLLQLKPPPRRPLLIAHPGVAMPTPAVFGRLAELRGIQGSSHAFSLSLADLSSWTGIEAIATNDLEEVAREVIPSLQRAKQVLSGAGASIALLSGSGASLFGVFPDRHSRDEAERQLAPIGYTTWRSHTLAAWPTPVSAALGGGSAIDPGEEIG